MSVRSRQIRVSVLAATALLLEVTICTRPTLAGGVRNPAGPSPRNPAGRTPTNPAGPSPRNPAGGWFPGVGGGNTGHGRPVGQPSWPGGDHGHGGHGGHVHGPGCGHGYQYGYGWGTYAYPWAGVVVTNPFATRYPVGANFYCAVHGIGFAYEQMFLEHLAYVDGIAPDYAAELLYDSGGVWVFPGIR